MSEKPTIPNTESTPSFIGRITSFLDLLKTEKGIAFCLLFLAILFNAVFLWPEVNVSTYSLNDEVLHLTAMQEASSVLHQHLNPTDFWLPLFNLGFPYFHYYQHLPQLVLAVINQGTSFFLPLPHLFNISRYILLVFFPLSVFWAMRRFDFDYLAAGLSALIASLLSTNGLYGFDYGSYIWRGWGLYTQIWAMFFLPLALAEIYRTIRKEGSWFWPVFLSAMVLLSSLIFGPILILSAAIFIVLTPDKAEIFSRFKRSAIIFILTALVTSYFFVSIIIDRSYLNRSIWEPSFAYNSFGAIKVLTNFFTGNLLDYGRLPVLTILFFLAALFVILQWKKENYRLVLVLTIFWLLIYCGRPPWGQLFDSLPFIQNLQFSRFINGFHLWAIMLTGAGLSLFWQWMKKCSFKGFSFRRPLVIGIVFLLLLTPAFLERVAFYQENAQWKIESQNVFLSKSNEISAINETLKNLPPGRVYAGLPADFGDAPFYTIGSVHLYAVLPQLGIDSFGRAYTPLDFLTDTRLEFNNTRPEQYNLFNIRYVLLHKTWTAPYYYSKIKEFNDYILYQVPTTGYFDLVDAPAVFYGNTSNFYYPNSRWLTSSLPKLKQNPIIELGNKPSNTSGLPVYSFEEVDQNILSNLMRLQPTAGEIVQENVSTNEYRARFVANRECYLMLKTNYHPGWVVTLDGKKVPTVMLAPGFIGIKVEPGTHQVIFSFQPPTYRLPLFVMGILVLILLGFYQWKVSRKK